MVLVGPVDAAKYPLAKKKTSYEYLREIAHLRPRTNTIGSVARIRNALAYATHTFFQVRRRLLVGHRPCGARMPVHCNSFRPWCRLPSHSGCSFEPTVCCAGWLVMRMLCGSCLHLASGCTFKFFLVHWPPQVSNVCLPLICRAFSAASLRRELSK